MTKSEILASDMPPVEKVWHIVRLRRDIGAGSWGIGARMGIFERVGHCCCPIGAVLDGEPAPMGLGECRAGACDSGEGGDVVIHLFGFPIAGGAQTGWSVSQDGRGITVIVCDAATADNVAGLCAHRASLLGVLAARGYAVFRQPRLTRQDAAAAIAELPFSALESEWTEAMAAIGALWRGRALDELQLKASRRAAHHRRSGNRVHAILWAIAARLIARVDRRYEWGFDAWAAERAEELAGLGGLWGWIGECQHDSAVLVTPCRGDKRGYPTWVCRCCGSFTDGDEWILSAPDVSTVRFPWPANRNVGETVPYPDGSAFFIHEVAP